MDRISNLLRKAKPLLATVLLLAVATPSHAIDARQANAGLLPVKAVVSAPQGAGNLCDLYAFACASGTEGVALDKAALDLVAEINRKANRVIRPVSDLEQYRVEERWTMPSKRGGDCEDYALFKKQALIEAGFAPQQLLIAAVLDRNGGSHAVLVLRTGKQDLILDNLNNTLKPWNKTGYTFLRMQNPQNPAQWVSVFAGGMFDKIS